MFGNKKKQQAPEAPKRKGAALANQVNITENHRPQQAETDSFWGIGDPLFLPIVFPNSLQHFFRLFEVSLISSY